MLDVNENGHGGPIPNTAQNQSGHKLGGWLVEYCSSKVWTCRVKRTEQEGGRLPDK